MFENYARYEHHLAQLQLVLFMLGMGASLNLGDFAGVFRRPRSFLTAAAGQFVLAPFLAVLASHWLDVDSGIAVGLILVAAMPGGTLSKVFTYLGRGNIALSISLTACGTLAAMATVPLLLRWLAAGFVPEDFDMPVDRILLELTLFLLLPLAAGMALGRLAPDHRAVFSRWCIRIGFVAVMAMIVGSLGSGRIHPAEYGWRAPLAIILFCILTMQLTMLPFRLLGWSRADCLSAGIEATMRNLNLALLLKALLFPAEKGADPIGDGVLFVILFYAAVALFSGLPLALNFRRLARKEATADALALQPQRGESS